MISESKSLPFPIFQIDNHAVRRRSFHSTSGSQNIHRTHSGGNFVRSKYKIILEIYTDVHGKGPGKGHTFDPTDNFLEISNRETNLKKERIYFFS